MPTKRLLEIKRQIDEAIPRQGEIAGQIKAIESQVNQKFQIKTISEMEKKLKEIGKEIDTKEAEFSSGMQELEGAHAWE